MTVRRETTIVVYPCFGFRAPDGRITIRVAGVVYQNREPLGLRKQFLVNMLTKAMHATKEEIDDATFRRRIAPFVAKPSKGERIWIQIGDEQFRLRRRSRGSGWFRGRIRISADSAQRSHGASNGSISRIPMRAWLSSNQSIAAETTAFILPEQGVSIVSDIDDTIKISNVANRRELLVNTFLREFRCVDGMAQLYREWAERGASFHYVSSSPWQLFDSLYRWTSDDGFPPGTLHLRTFRLRDQVIRRRANAKKRKWRSITRMLKDFPGRRFVLIGDSGERDPEIYCQMCDRFGDRIAAIFIRQLENDESISKRMRKLKRLAAPIPCEPFESSTRLKDLAANIV